MSELDGFDTQSDDQVIHLSEPVGEDLDVWNEVKADPNLAFALQIGRVGSIEVSRKANTLAERYPNSTTGQLLGRAGSYWRRLSDQYKSQDTSGRKGQGKPE